MFDGLKRGIAAYRNKSHNGFPSFVSNNSSFEILDGFFAFFRGTRNNFKQYLKSYGSHPIVFMVVNKIAETSASIKRVAVDSNDEPIENSVLLDLLNNPNPDQNRIEFYESMNVGHEATGNAYIWHIKGIGAGDELKVLPSDKVEILLDSNKNETIGYRYTRPNGTNIKIPVEDVLHVHTSNVVNTTGEDAKYGLSRLQAAWVVVKSSGEKFSASASIFKNRGIIGILTSKGNTPMKPKERQEMQEAFEKEAGGADNYNKLKVSSTELNYIQTGMSPTDLKLIEGLVQDMRTISSIYGLSSVIFNDTANSTYNNVSEAVRSAYNEVYIPLGNKFDDKLSVWLSERLGVDEKVIIDLTSIEVIKASTNQVAQSLSSLSPLLANKVLESMTEDEVRDLINLGALAEGAVTIGRSGADPNINVGV